MRFRNLWQSGNSWEVFQLREFREEIKARPRPKAAGGYLYVKLWGVGRSSSPGYLGRRSKPIPGNKLSVRTYPINVIAGVSFAPIRGVNKNPTAKTTEPQFKAYDWGPMSHQLVRLT